MKVVLTVRHNIILAKGIPSQPSTSFSSLPYIAFFYGSVLQLFMPMPEIILQSDYHLVRHASGVNVSPQAGKIRFPNKVILTATK